MPGLTGISRKPRRLLSSLSHHRTEDEWCYFFARRARHDGDASNPTNHRLSSLASRTASEYFGNNSAKPALTVSNVSLKRLRGLLVDLLDGILQGFERGSQIVVLSIEVLLSLLGARCLVDRGKVDRTESVNSRTMRSTRTCHSVSSASSGKLSSRPQV